MASFEFGSYETPTTKKLVLVTGGAGFIGSHVAEALLRRGDDVIIVDEVNDYYDVKLKQANLKLLESQYGKDRLRIYIGDICDVPFISNIFETEKPKWIVHLAARAGVRPSIQDPFIYIHSNVEATTRLLELACKYGNESFVFASSSSVYGGSKASVFKETDVVDFPVSPYAATKKACELIAFTYHHLYGLNVAGLRFFTVYGPRGRPDMAPFKFIDRVSRSLVIQQFGDGSSSRDYTYIDDIVNGVILSLDTPLGYQIYNLGNGNPVGLRDFISIVETAVGKQAVIDILPDQPGDVPRTAADISKARRLLGYEPKVSFEEGISRLAEWYRGYYGTDLDQPSKSTTTAASAVVVVTDASVGQPMASDNTSESSMVSSINSTTSPDAGPTSPKPTMKKSTSKLSFILGSHGETGSF
jgi:UDP-glucuronate 4-epimerase